MIDRVYQNQGNKAVLEQIKGINLEILDVGCGAGDNAVLLKNLGHQVDGITHAEEEIKICKEKMRSVLMHDLSYGLPQDLRHQYDLVICSHVLEHIAYPEKLLLDIKHVMKESAILIVALPNLMHYKSRLKLLFGRFEYEETGIWDSTHLRWYTFSSGSKLLERNGYEIVRSWVDGEIPAFRLFRFVPNAVRKKLFNSLIRISRGLFGGQLLYMAKVKRPLS